MGNRAPADGLCLGRSDGFQPGPGSLLQTARLADRRHGQRGGAPTSACSRRDAPARLTSTAGEAAALQAPHGLEASLGLHCAHRFQLRPGLLAHGGTGPRGGGADDRERATADRRTDRQGDGHRHRRLPHREPRLQHVHPRRRRRPPHILDDVARIGEILMGYYPMLDRAPQGRDEGEAWQLWIRRHDECESE
jgi:hypothetical protein